jgi:hypothetical protein
MGAGGQDGMNYVHGVLSARFAVDPEPSFQGDLALITGPAAADHDRIVVGALTRVTSSSYPAVSS